jgi:hypothetical protein
MPTKRMLILANVSSAAISIAVAVNVILPDTRALFHVAIALLCTWILGFVVGTNT